ncbi:hypothetical protein [Klebsiella pneumoniae ISC21]|nr:hypothetical protein [Klebsiella pneumoniae ISC21]
MDDFLLVVIKNKHVWNLALKSTSIWFMIFKVILNMII